MSIQLIRTLSYVFLGIGILLLIIAIYLFIKLDLYLLMKNIRIKNDKNINKKDYDNVLNKTITRIETTQVMEKSSSLTVLESETLVEDENELFHMIDEIIVIHSKEVI